MKANRIIYQIGHNLTLVAHKQIPQILPYICWELFQKLLDHSGYHESVLTIKWLTPKPGFIKLNIDGCSKGNPGPSGAGGIIRNEQGQMIIAFAMPLGNMSNNLAEAPALKNGIELCISKGIKNLEVESDC